jgi:hypothetical protein
MYSMHVHGRSDLTEWTHSTPHIALHTVRKLCAQQLFFFLLFWPLLQLFHFNQVQTENQQALLWPGLLSAHACSILSHSMPSCYQYNVNLWRGRVCHSCMHENFFWLPDSAVGGQFVFWFPCNACMGVRGKKSSVPKIYGGELDATSAPRRPGCASVAGTSAP